MNITRRAFLGCTTAFTAVGLFHPLASAPIDPQNLNRDRWYAVWFQPDNAAPIMEGRFTGIDHYDLPENTFLTFDAADRWKLRTAKPGQGFKRVQEVTTHVLPDDKLAAEMGLMRKNG